MRVSTWNIPEDRKEALSQRFSWVTNLPKFQLVPFFQIVFLGEFLSKGFRLLALFKATRCLPVVTRPHLPTSSRWSGNRGRVVLGMCGLDVPKTSTYMITSSLAPLLMNPSSICLNRTVACQAHTSLRQQLWRSCRTMSPTFIRYGGCILLWWICGDHGGTILPGPERSLISCGLFGIVRTLVE